MAKARIANGIASREFLGIFGIAFVQRDEGLAIVDIHDQVVDFPYIVALITQESTLPGRVWLAAASIC